MKKARSTTFCINAPFVLFVLLSLAGCSGDASSLLNSADASVTDAKCDEISIDRKSLALTTPRSKFTSFVEAELRRSVGEDVDMIGDPSTYKRSAKSEHIRLHFAIAGTPFCRAYADAHIVEDDVFMNGVIPGAIRKKQVQGLDWEGASYQKNQLLDALGSTGTLNITSDNECLLLASDKKTVDAARTIDFTIDRLPYTALIARGEVVEASEIFHLATGKTQVLRKNPVGSSNVVLKDVTLNNISEGGSLCDPYFVTVVPKTFTKAFSKSFDFTYPQDDLRFNEVSVFANAQIQAAWFLGLEALAPGGQWPGKRINLELYDNDDYYVNNQAVYLPKTTSTPPKILLGNGDKYILQNLHLDYDVIAHELGHHFVYQRLSEVNTAKDSARIHEALADYFVFAKTDNSCLGEIICPESGDLCNTGAKCLRSAETGLQYNGTGWSAIDPDAFHKQSQFISGMLWSLRRSSLQAMAELMPLTLSPRLFQPT